MIVIPSPMPITGGEIPDWAGYLLLGITFSLMAYLFWRIHCD